MRLRLCAVSRKPLGIHMDAQWRTRTRSTDAQARRMQEESSSRCREALLSGACQAAGGSDAHRGRDHICGGACSRRERCIGERLGEKGVVTRERMREMSARRASDRAAVIAASTIDVDEMGTYMGAKDSSWRHACATVYSWLKKLSNRWGRKKRDARGGNGKRELQAGGG